MNSDREIILAAIRECITVVKRGEILAVRVSTMDEDDLNYLSKSAEKLHEEMGIRLLFVEGEEFARLGVSEEERNVPGGNAT